MRLSEGAAGRLGICPDLWHVVVGHPTESVTGPVPQGTRRTMRILHSPLMGCGIPGPVTVGPGSPLLEACGGHRIRVASCPDASSYFNKKSRHDVGDQVKGMGVTSDDIRDPIPSEVTPSTGEFSIRGGGGIRHSNLSWPIPILRRGASAGSCGTGGGTPRVPFQRDGRDPGVALVRAQDPIRHRSP